MEICRQSGEFFDVGGASRVECSCGCEGNGKGRCRRGCEWVGCQWEQVYIGASYLSVQISGYQMLGWVFFFLFVALIRVMYEYSSLRHRLSIAVTLASCGISASSSSLLHCRFDGMLPQIYDSQCYVKGSQSSTFDLSRAIGLASLLNQNPVLILPWVFLPAEAKGSRSVNSF